MAVDIFSPAIKQIAWFDNVNYKTYAVLSFAFNNLILAIILV